MEQYLIDNNAISAFFAGTLPEQGMDFMATVIDQIPTISVITEIEALSWVSLDKNKEQIIKTFVRDAVVLPLTSDIVARCIKLRRSRKIKTPDAIIAATALVHHLTLITNDRIFKRIPTLQVIDPTKLS
jgi:predicted nucleic acid-binding protein